MCSIFGVFDIKTDAVELRKKSPGIISSDAPSWPGLVGYLRQ
ncbi:asparagine synthetase B [Citrobacter freundii]|nr:asparagine synthetase B [Citrobacter freundii]